MISRRSFFVAPLALAGLAPTAGAEGQTPASLRNTGFTELVQMKDLEEHLTTRFLQSEPRPVPMTPHAWTWAKAEAERLG